MQRVVLNNIVNTGRSYAKHSGCVNKRSPAHICVGLAVAWVAIDIQPVCQ